MLGQQLQQHDLGFDHLGGIVGAIDRQSDLDLLITLEDVALRNRIHPLVFDGADRRFLADVNVDGPAFGRLLTLHADVFKVTAGPDGTKIALQRGLVVYIARGRVDACLYGFGGNAPVSADVNVLYDLPGLLNSMGPPGKQPRKEKAKDQRQGPDPSGTLRTGLLKKQRCYMTTLRTRWEKPDYTG